MCCAQENHGKCHHAKERFHEGNLQANPLCATPGGGWTEALPWPAVPASGYSPAPGPMLNASSMNGQKMKIHTASTSLPRVKAANVRRGGTLPFRRFTLRSLQPMGERSRAGKQ